MSQQRLALTIVCLALLLSACASRPHVTYNPESPLLGQRLLYQLVNMSATGNHKRLLLVLEYDQGQIRFVGMNAAGMNQFTLQRDVSGDQLKMAAFAKLPFKPTSLLDELLTVNTALLDKQFVVQVNQQHLQLTLLSKGVLE